MHFGPCGYCGGETNTGGTCMAGCENIRPAKLIFKGRDKPRPMSADDLKFCPNYDESKEALREHLVECCKRNELFEEMVELMKRQQEYGINQCGCHHHPDRRCTACERKTLLAKIEATE